MAHLDLTQFVRNIPSPVRSVQEGVLFGQQQSDRAAALEAERVQREQQQKVNAELVALSQKENKTPEDFINLMTRFPSIAQQFQAPLDALNAQQRKTAIAEATDVFAALSGGNDEAAIKLLEDKKTASENSGDEIGARRAEVLIESIRLNPDAALTSAGLFLSQATGDSKLLGRILSPEGEKGTEERAFNALLEDLTPEEQRLAKDIKLGLKKRAGAEATAKVFDIGGVPHILNPQGEAERVVVAGEVITAEGVAESEAFIAEKVELAKGEARRTTKAIDRGFESMGKIRGNIANINRAIAALDKGAKTGAIQRFLPNVTAASVELGQIQKELALDIISAVTFGALSQGELDLALSTALPTGLDETELREFLVEKRDAQEKLNGYFLDQINFLDAGGSLVDFVNQQQKAFEENAEGADTEQRVVQDGNIFERQPDGSMKFIGTQ